jgi:hypothetical protein
MNAPASAFDLFVERYVSVWNEGDAAARREMIAALWATDGANFTSSLEHRGYAALETRVRTSWEKWVRDGGCFFRPRHAQNHHGVAHIEWEMVSLAGEVKSIGREFLLLAADGRIAADYQFVP